MSKDLMFQDEIKDAVRDAYGSIESGAGEVVASMLYSEEELAELPAGARDWALGVGNPVRYAFLQPGEVVLDVGSGGGIDTILAARRVGPTGRAIGLDIVEDMLERGRRHAAQAGVERRTEFIPGAMEAGLGSLLFWGSLIASLVIAGAAAFPLNRWLISRGMGHAVIHAQHH